MLQCEDMKIYSWNVNGIRAIHRKGNWDDFLKVSPDIFCLQETKAHPEQLVKDILEPEGYHSYFSSCEIKKGYSGVAIYTKEKPERVEHGMGIKEFDQEGRIITAYFKDFVILNIYFPNGGGGPVRLQYKMDFYDEYLGELYEAEDRVFAIIEFFAIVAIIIGCLGLLGLVSFIALQKTKEIGIRKVHGATELNILM